MTLQERYDAKKSEVEAQSQRYAALRAEGIELEKALIASDAELKLLEDLLKEQAA